MSSSTDIWKRSLEEARNTLSAFEKVPGIWEKLDEMTELIYSTFKNDGTVFTCGNGGSHCDAMHFAEEWTGRYRKNRKPVAALALGDPSHMSCVGNDYGFEHVYARQLQALGRKGDLLILLSTSGKSQNQILAAQAAKEKGIRTLALLGRDGGTLKDKVDFSIIVPAELSERIQEIHIKLIHISIETVERKLFPELY